MKLIAQLFAATALLAGLNNAFAADGRKEATIDLGKGAFKLTVSVPGTTVGPYDTASNPGPRVNVNNKDGKGTAYGEVMFKGKADESSTVIFEARAATNFDAKPIHKGALAGSLAKSVIKDEGFEGRATPIDCPPAPIEGATTVCYKMSGNSIFDGNVRTEKSASILMAVSFSNDKHGFTIMGSIIERDASKFDANKDKYETGALNAVGDMYQHLVVKPL